MNYKPEQYTSGSRHGGERETQAHVLLNSIFVSYASIFDLLSKIAVEQFMFDQYDFTNYKLTLIAAVFPEMPQTAFKFDSVILTVVMKILNKITRKFVFR